MVEEINFEGCGDGGLGYVFIDVEADVSPVVAQSDGVAHVLDAKVGRQLSP